MNIEKAWEHHRFHSTRFSDVMRQGALASVAVIWALQVPQGNTVSMPRNLVGSAFLLILGLVVDALQYGIASKSWQTFCEGTENELGEQFPDDIAAQKAADFRAGPDVNLLAFTLYWAKTALMACGVLVLLFELFRRFFL
jgi:hypothetical protein